MKFDVVYADPPWEFQHAKTGGSYASGASQKYPTMALSELQPLPVQAVSQPTAVLFLWVPTRLKFSHGLPTAVAWGFGNYETTIYWNKCRLGMGYWFRNQVEELLVFTRGNMAPFRCQLPNIISLAALGHSEKPDEFRRLIEDATGKFSRRACLELFARRSAVGWRGIGHKITGRDIRQDLKLLATDDPAIDL